MSPTDRTLPPRVIVQFAESRLRRAVNWLSWIGCVILFLVVIQQAATINEYTDADKGIQERLVSGSELAPDKIAVITISGVILEGDGFVKKQIDRVREDEAVKAIVVRVDSPGGTVTGSDYIYHHLKKLREEKQVPLVVSMGSVAASGGYYVAMAVGDQPDSIFAEPTTTTGSIGVLIPHYDFSGLLERFDVKDDSIASHPRKLILSMTRPMPDDHRVLLEQHVQDLFERFKQIVHEGRPQLRNGEKRLERDGVDLATGEIFTADDAVTHGLVDRIGFVEDAVARARELAGLDQSRVRVVRYQRSGALLDTLIGGDLTASSGAPSQLLELLEASVPRAYYLCTSLPPLVSSYPRGQ